MSGAPAAPFITATPPAPLPAGGTATGGWAIMTGVGVGAVGATGTVGGCRGVGVGAGFSGAGEGDGAPYRPRRT